MTAPYPAMTDKRGEKRAQEQDEEGERTERVITRMRCGKNEKKKLAEPQMEWKKEMKRMK